MTTIETRRKALELAREQAVERIQEFIDGDPFRQPGDPAAEQRLDRIIEWVRSEIAVAGKTVSDPGAALLEETRELRERVTEHLQQRERGRLAGVKDSPDGLPVPESYAERLLRDLFSAVVLPPAPADFVIPRKRALICDAFRSPGMGWWRGHPTSRDLALISVLAGASEANGKSAADLISNEARAMALAWEHWGATTQQR